MGPGPVPEAGSPIRIFSGGQSGVDRAALDVAGRLGIERGGWCPAGGLAEDYLLPPGLLARYPELRETDSADPRDRTERNVQDSDATLVIVPVGVRSPGTQLTQELAMAFDRPWYRVDLAVGAVPPVSRRVIEDAASWWRGLPGARILNVAGPRESQAPGVAASAEAFLEDLLAELGHGLREERAG